ncbi:hypothetical protein CPHO_02155 [Corynebacterium phocae]|uniref:Lipoprotein LpqE n=1 Tax=Corynebacterium phocae TaxID=161895 RepID=A0A1L7D1E8_9CORY|nr:hypothetical protein [Corynebacterium phocae]APT91907.1 hypothetical protein CPHO_02155 [Corynebacterium phocae]KAA8727365.1 hypothetical protein F4V58_01690 [Corynebacterium phocae]
MKSLKFAARRGAIISVAAVSALALASCSAGQNTQTSDKVIAIDGANATLEDGNIAVQDVNIQLEPDTGEASLKFSAINKGYTGDPVTLKSIDVDGQTVSLKTLEALQPIGRNSSIIGNSKANLDAIPLSDADNIQYVATFLENDDYGYAGSRPVTFNFSVGSVTVDAPISASPLEAGAYNRDPKSVSGYTTESPDADAHGHAHADSHGKDSHGH